MTTSSLLPRLGHWISTAMVFLFFAILPLSRCEGQQAPKARQSEISETGAKVPNVGQAPDASDPSSMSDAQLEKAIKNHSPKQATQSQPWDASLVKFLTISVLAFGLIVIVIMAVLVAQK